MLEKFVDNKQLNPEDSKKCTQAINKLRDNFEDFDEYVIPANFFGPGKDYAYVGPGTTQQYEDIQNVEFDFYKGKEFLALDIKKQKKPVSSQMQFNQICLGEIKSSQNRRIRGRHQGHERRNRFLLRNRSLKTKKGTMIITLCR